MKLKPLQDWALIQRIEPKEMTAAGIVIPESAKDKPTEGIILSIGPGKFKTEKGGKKDKEKEKKFVPTVLKPGQRIIYGKYSAREFELDGETIVLVREEDVLGTVEETGVEEKARFEITEKYEQPVAVKKETQVMKVAPSGEMKKSETQSSKKNKPLIKKAATKKQSVSKAVEKPAPKKTQ